MIYPIQFEDDPRDGCERVAGLIVGQRPLGYGPEEYVAALRHALVSDVDLATLIPQAHSDDALREYFEALLPLLEEKLTAQPRPAALTPNRPEGSLLAC